jgi:hypothetical protein
MNRGKKQAWPRFVRRGPRPTARPRRPHIGGVRGSMAPSVSLIICIAAVFIPATGSLVARQPGSRAIPITDLPTCTTCRIILDSLVTLSGSEESGVALSHYSRAVAMSSHYVLGPTYAPGQIAVFDPQGALLRTFGRRGSGPGELQGSSFSLAPGPGDSLHVLDRSRWNVFRPARYDFARVTVLRAAPVAFAILSRSRMIAVFPWQPASGLTFSVNLVSSTGDVLRSFDPTDPEYVQDPRDHARILHVIDGDAIWTSPLNRVVIRRESLTTGDVTLWTRQDGWFPPCSGFDSREPFFARPGAYVTALRTTPGVIWLHAVVADDDWRPHAGPEPSREREVPRITGWDPNRVYDSVIEAIDQASGAVLARRRTDWVWRPLTGSPDLVQRTRETPAGEIVVDILRVRLER